MPQPLVWTPEQDDFIRRMRRAGATWSEIGDGLGLSRNAVLERGHRINAWTPAIAPAAAPDIDRPGYCLPAGHRISWAILTRGTLLEGVPFRPVGTFG